MTVKKYDLRRSQGKNKFLACDSFHRKFDQDSPKVCTDTKTTSDDIISFSYFQLYRYSTVFEKFLIFLGFILATLASLGIPYSLINSGEFHTLLIERHSQTGTSSETFLLNLFGGGKILTNASKEENMAALRQDAQAFGIATLVGAIVEWILLAISVDVFNRVAVKQTNRIRKLFLKSVISQDMSWYDTASDNNFASKMTEDLSKLKDGIGEKVAIFTNLVMSFVTTMILSLFFGWKLILIIMICCPVIIAATILVGKIQSRLTEKELRTYSNAGSLAEEVFRGIRTVFAFSGEQKEAERYNQLLVPATKAGHKKGLYIGICAGAMWVIIYTCFALALYFVARKAIAGGKNELPAVVVTVLLGIILEAQSVGLALPHLESFAAAKSAAESIFAIIDRRTAIDPLSEEGLKPEGVSGDINFENVHFRYPSRPEVKVLKGLSLSIKAGQTVAFVGPSGCGKTTCLQLLQRFYDPESGSVYFDGRDLRKLNVAWLRAQIGVVGQEPVLFSDSIGENIRYGSPGITQEEIEEACKMAYCHNFISQLPDGYDTLVGEMGSKMSGGQKQRIAIARALAKKPKILLLDEATSALDSTNEKLVQDALEAACKGRTTLIVAHRLSTVRDADSIVFVKDGVVMEQGSHDELMNLKGHYYGLMEATSQDCPTLEGRLSNTPSMRSVQDSQLDVENNSEDGAVSEYSKSEKISSLRRFLRLNAPEWRYILFGCLAAVLQGSTGSIWAFCFGEFIGFMSELNNAFEEKATKIAIIAVAVGLLAGFTNLVQTFMLNVAGTNLTSRLRQMAFKAIISQDVGYFDDQTNSVGALCSRLGGDCCNVQEATGSRFGIMVQSLSTLLIAIFMSLAFSWNLTLVTLVMVPLVVGSIILESSITEKSFNEENLATEKASQVAVEAVTNIRTINSLGQEKYVLERYSRQVDLAYQASKEKTRFRGIVFGFGDASQCIAFGISLFYGGLLVADGLIEYKNIIKISEALQLGTMMLAQAFAYAPDVNEAKVSVQRLLRLFDRVPAIRSPSEQLPNKNINDDISFRNVGFHYPSRKSVQVLQNFNLEICKGTSVALVGSSGCGKSTCVQLLLRYYDPSTGVVSFGGAETKDYQLENLRSQIGLVSQEPVLFDRTIAENIAYGDNFRETIPMSEIIEAAKNSNIHDFIVALPEGYDTLLSSKGAQLSCGQKQRIAIARALVRNPKVLVLDEATSALDMQSEKLVQEALDKAGSGRTSIIIAQRLNTVRNADMICVVHNGCVQEKGTHEELLKLNGIYAELLRMQQ